MSTPEEIAVQEAAAATAAQAVTDEAKKAADEAAKVTPTDDETKKGDDDATRQAEKARVAEEARKAKEAEPTEGAEARIRKLIGEREDARREAAYLRGLAEGRQPKPADTAPAPLKIEDYLPNEQEFAAVGLTAENFEKAGRSYDDLLMAKSAYAMQKRTVVLAKQAEEGRAKESVAKAQATFMERINKAAETDPGILEIMEDRTLPVSQTMAEIIRESEVAPKILRHLSANRAEGMRIAQLSPLAAARELGRIEAKIMAAPAPTPPNRISQAPAPITPLTPTGVTEIDLDKVPIGDFMKKRNAQQYGATGR
jgi:hypothetical protein